MAIFVDGNDNTLPKRRARVKASAKVTLINDALIDEKLEKSDTWIQTITRKWDWVSTDNEWESLLEASETRAASKISGITKETYDGLVAEYNKTVKALTGKDTELQENTIDPISVGPNVTNELASDNYIPDRDVWPE